MVPEIEDKIQRERREIYVEPNTREVLRKLIKNRKEGEITPSYHPALGFIYELKGTKKGDEEHRYTKAFLENLVRLDILQKSFYDSISTCPKCRSTASTLHPSCTKCKSHNIAKTSLTEHIPCGYIDQREKYAKELCPKCGKILIEGEYRNMGRWYICNECGEKFEHPQFNLICRECDNSFSIEEANVQEVPKFILNPKREKEIRQNVASLESISKLFTDLGFKVEMPGSMIGQKTEMEYHFSMLARKQKESDKLIISVDHEVAEEEIHAQPIQLYIYKLSEIKVSVPIFMAMPKLSEAARKIAKGHDILIIEGTPQAQDMAQIKDEIEKRINQICFIQSKPNEAVQSATESEEKPPLPKASVNSSSHRKTPLRAMLKGLKLLGNTDNNTADSPSSNSKPENDSRRNIVFLLDGSSSMTRGNDDLNNFALASKAIKDVFKNPDPKAKNDFLSIIVFWDTIMKGLQKEILYEDLPMSTHTSLQKLSQFEPKKNAGTPIWDAVEYAIDFLQKKRGYKIVKLITDAKSIPSPKNGTMKKLENSSTRLDCIVVGSEGNVELGKAINNYELGRFYESSNTEYLALTLKS